jgi:hypothetical protein
VAAAPGRRRGVTVAAVPAAAATRDQTVSVTGASGTDSTHVTVTVTVTVRVTHRPRAGTAATASAARPGPARPSGELRNLVRRNLDSEQGSVTARHFTVSAALCGHVSACACMHARARLRACVTVGGCVKCVHAIRDIVCVRRACVRAVRAVRACDT